MLTVRVCALVVFCGCAAEPGEGVQHQLVTTTQTGDTTVTTIEVRGKDAFTFLNSDDTTGSLTASRDEVAGTKALSFGYSTPHPTDPDIAVSFTGAGEIPNSSFQVSHSAAELHVTTSFPVTRCEFNTSTGDMTCADSTAIRFDLSWTADGVQVIKEFTRRKEKLGPTTTKVEGEFKSWSAVASGTWTDHSGTNMTATLQDTESNTVIREITTDPTP